SKSSADPATCFALRAVLRERWCSRSLCWDERLLLQHRLNQLLDVCRHLLCSLRGEVHTVGLNVAVDAIDILQKKRQQRKVKLFRERGVHGIEVRDVGGAILWGEGAGGGGARAP